MKDSKSKFVINILVKILYLFIFLTILFYLIIQPQLTKGLRLMTTNMLNNFIFRTDNIVLQTHLENNRDRIRKLDEVIPMTKHSTDTYNSLLLSANIIIIIFTALIILSIYLSKRQDIPILKILGFNLLLFSVVGMIEYLFFMKVAGKYVPIKMSEIIEIFKETMLR